MTKEVPSDVMKLLTMHRKSFYDAIEVANKTAHPVPSDTRAWSQILVSLLTGINGIARKKGADLADGSDVKAANLWQAIDTPRFNGCIKSGRKGDMGNIEGLNEMPHLFFVMWDKEPEKQCDRCRVWFVRPRKDAMFRAMCKKWYDMRDERSIRSDNFQLHPPRNANTNVFRNKCGNLEYPLLFAAEYVSGGYKVVSYNPSSLSSGTCKSAEE